jgi:hypothetical protein
MIDFAYTAYVVTFWPFMAIVLSLALMDENRALGSGVLVTMAAQGAVTVWDYYNPVFEYQPAGLAAIIYLIAAAIVTIRPSGKLCGMFAIIFMACFGISAITFASVRSYSADLLFYQVHVILGWASVLLTGWGVFNGGGGIYSVDSVRRDSKLADVAHNRKMER